MTAVNSIHSLVLHALHHVTAERLQKAVDGLVNGAYIITLTSSSETELRGFVTNGDGKEYGVALSDGQAFCSCKDAMYRKGICKHAVVLVLPLKIDNSLIFLKLKSGQGRN